MRRYSLFIFILIFLMYLCSFCLLLIPSYDSEKINIIDIKNDEQDALEIEKVVLNFDDDGNEIDTPEIKQEEIEKYYYNLLDDDSKQVYDIICNGIVDRESIISIPTTREETFKRIYYCFSFDNPELFYVSDKYDYKVKEGYVIEFYPEYKISKELYDEQMQLIANELKKVTTNTKDMSDYEKELYIQDYILSKCSYETNGNNVTNIYGTLIEGYANCRGYSATFSYLLNKCGVQSGQIIGTVIRNNEDTGHSWNFVILDNQYYYCDICWNDIAKSTDNSDVPYHYAFFNLTYDRINRTHNDENQRKYLYEINETNDETYFFLKYNGLYIYNYEEIYDIINNKLPEILNNKNYIIIQCDNDILYKKVCYNITDIIKESIKSGNINISQCKYIKIDNGYTIIIHDFVKI